MQQTRTWRKDVFVVETDDGYLTSTGAAEWGPRYFSNRYLTEAGLFPTKELAEQAQHEYFGNEPRRGVKVRAVRVTTTIEALP